MTGALPDPTNALFGSLLEKLRGRRVLVAGGAGFVGSAIVRELLALDVQTVAFDNFFHGPAENLENLSGPLTVEYCDARRLESVKTLVDKVRADFVINCIGDTYVPTAYYEPQRFFDINLGCHLNLLLALDVSRLRRMIYVSSTEVYGSVQAEAISEGERIGPVNTYAVSKTAADCLSYTFCLEHGLPLMVARIFNCYGPRATHPYVIPEIIAQFTRGKTVRLGNLKAKRDFTYVHDTARALIALLTCSAKNGGTVNVGSGTTYSVEWLARTIAHEMEIENPEILSHPSRLRKHDIDSFRCDNAKLRRLTGWAPGVGMVEGLRQTIRWYGTEGRQWSWEKRTHDVSLSTGAADPAWPRDGSQAALSG